MKLLIIFLFISNAILANVFTLDKKDIQVIKNSYHKDKIVTRFNNMYEFLQKAKQFNEIKKLNRVNSYINRIIGKTDKTNEWISPKEFLIRGRGDCEDYAISKYFVLQELNIDANKMYLSVVKKRGSKNFHMVLLYVNKKGIIFVLDNLSWKLVPLQKRKDLIFKFAFNEKASYILKNDKLVKEKNIRRGEVLMFKNMLKNMLKNVNKE